MEKSMSKKLVVLGLAAVALISTSVYADTMGVCTAEIKKEAKGRKLNMAAEKAIKDSCECVENKLGKNASVGKEFNVAMSECRNLTLK